MQDISAVVCTWNSVASLRACLNSLRENEVKEIIVVDANSDDGTRDIANELADKVLTDPRMGLAAARNIGISKCTAVYVINVGADNIMPRNSIKVMLETKAKMNWAGVSAATIMQDSSINYFSWAMNHYKKARFFPGERAVIGTPTIFETKLLQQNPYDPKMSWSDDGEICSRLGAVGHKFGIADVVVRESGSESFQSVWYRWKGYGKSDWETYTKFSLGWNLCRKTESLLYPLKNELFLPFLRIQGLSRIGAFPFLICITSIRYWYWMSFTLISMKQRA
jgi:glycosyltransferase involved in cell wall biosynthesis